MPTPKQAARGPFTEMSDFELDRYIMAWATLDPERYNMEGDWSGSQRALHAHWRQVFRSWPAAEQNRQMQELSRYRMASKVAKRWLSTS
jgi:hypothetical protein